MSSFSPSIFPSLLFSFNFEEIASDAYHQHKSLQEDKPQEKPIQTYKLVQLFTDEGVNLVELFGYHLSKKLKNRSLKQRSQEKLLIWYELNDFQKLMLDVWHDMDNYAILLQPLFKLLKQSLGGYINLKHMDKLAEICKESIKCDLFADIKFKISPRSLSKIKKKVFELAEKEDLKGSGLLQKSKILQVFTQVVGQTVIKEIDFSQLPRQLTQGEYVNYELLFTQEYLLSGQKVKQFMQGYCANRIVKLIKKSNKRKSQDKTYKANYLKKAIKQDINKLSGVRPQVKNQKLLKKQQKKQSIITTLLQKDNKQANELKKNKLLTAKQILMEVIYDAVEVAENLFMKDERKKQAQKHEQTKKSIYTIDPVVSEDLFQNMWQPSVRLQLMKSGVGFFVHKNQGYSFEMDSSLLTNDNNNSQSLKRLNKINLSISSLIKPAKIIDYEILNKKLYLIREDGLFYVWNFFNQSTKKDCYQAMIQTSFKSFRSQHLQHYYKQMAQLNNRCSPQQNSQKIITIDHESQIIVINCSSDPISPCLELYDCQLQYIGRIPLNKQLLSLSYEQYFQANFFLHKISPSMKSDQPISSKQDYSNILMKHNYPFSTSKPQLLGYFIIDQFAHKGLIIQVQHFQSYFKYATSNKSCSKIPFVESNFNDLNNFKNHKLPFSKLNPEMLSYLRDMNYIKNIKQEDLRLFLSQTSQTAISSVKDRKYNIFTLFQDNYSVFEDLLTGNEFSNLITKNKFINLLKQCDFTEKQALHMIDTFPSTPDNLVDISEFLFGEHTLRVKDFKQGKVLSTKKYKSLILPSIELSGLHVVLKHQIVILGLKQGPNSCSKLYVLNLKGNLINQISITDSFCPASPLFSTYISQTNHLLCLKHQTIYIYNIYSLVSQSNEPISPVKIIQGVQLPGNSIQSQILSLIYSYAQNSLMLLTTQAFYVFDFTEMIQQKSQQKKFKIKPGYIAVTTDPSSNKSKDQTHEVKRRYLTNSNQQNTHMLVSPSKYGQNYITIVSCNRKSSDLHIKSFYISRHELKITKEQISKPLPIKLFKELQARAKRNHYQDPSLETEEPTKAQHQLSLNMVDYFRKKFMELVNPQNSAVQNDSNFLQTNSLSKQKTSKNQAIIKLNNIYSLLNNTKSLIISPILQPIKHSIPEKQLKLSLIMIILLSDTQQQLSQNLSSQFINLYRTPSGNLINSINRKEMLNDLTTTEEKIWIERLLYFCSLIDKFLTPVMPESMEQKEKAQLIKDTLSNFDKGLPIDLDKIAELICVKHKIKSKQVQKQTLSGIRNSYLKSSSTSLQKPQTKSVMIPSPNLVTSTFQSLMELAPFRQIDPVEIVTNIILRLLPTKYKYLCPRYFKEQISFEATKQKSSSLAEKIENEFFSNNFGSLSSQVPFFKEFVEENIVNNPIDSVIEKEGFVQFLKNRNGFYLYKDQIERKYPQVKRNYRKLIEMLFSYKIINQLQMIKLITSDKAFFVEYDEKSMAQSIKKFNYSQGIDSIMQLIYQNITLKQLRLPKPYITLQYFKQTLYLQPNAQQIFFKHFLKSFDTTSETQPQVYTRNFTPIVQFTAKKNITMEYHPQQWQNLVGDKVVPLISYVSQLQQNFAEKQSIKFQEFKDMLENYTDTDSKDLVMLCAEASLPYTRRRQILKQQLKTRPHLFSINTQFFIKYLNDRKKQFFSKLFSSVSATQKLKSEKETDYSKFEESLKISSFNLIECLWNSGNFLDQNELLYLVSHSINEIGLKDVNSWIEKHILWVKVNVLTADEQNVLISKDHKRKSLMMQKESKKQLFIDPLQLKFVIKHLETNVELTLETIAWKLFQEHETIDFVKSFNSKSVTVEGRVSFQQAAKYIGCESVTRWLLKMRSQNQAIQLIEFHKILKTLTNVICKKIWTFNILAWGDKINLILSLFKSFADTSNSRQKSSQQRKKATKLSSLAKYFIHPQLSLIQQGSQWVTVLKYIYARYKHYLHSNESAQNKKEKNLMVLMKAVKDKTEEREFKHELDVDEVELDEFFNCINWSINEVDFIAIDQVENQLGNLINYEYFKVQKLIELTQPQQLKLIIKTQENIVEPKPISQKPLNYSLTPQILQKVFGFDQLHSILPSKFSFSTLIQLHQQFNHTSTKSDALQNLSSFKDISHLTSYEKSLLKKLYKSILQNSSHQNNTLNEFYQSMKYQEYTKIQNSNKLQVLVSLKDHSRIDKCFPQFYSKLKNFSKTLSKLNFFDISMLYHLLKVYSSEEVSVRESEVNLSQKSQKNLNVQKEKKKQHLFSYSKLFRYSSLLISQKIKEEWVANYISTSKTIQFLNQKKSYEEQIAQYKVNLAVYQELILCSMWDKPIDPSISQYQKVQIIQKITQNFDFPKYIYKKWFSDDDSNSKVIYSTLSKIDELQQFVKKAFDLFNNEITQMEAVTLFDFMDRNKKQALKEMGKPQNFNDTKLMTQNKTQLFAQCLSYLLNVREIQNTNLLWEQSQGFKKQFNLIYSYLIESHLLNDAQNPTHNQVHVYQTSEKIIKSIKQLTQKLIRQELQVRNLIKNTVKNLLNTSHLKLQTFYKTILNIDISDENQNIFGSMNEKMSHVLNFLLMKKDLQFKKIHLFEKVDWESQSLRDFLLEIIVQTYIQYDSHGIQRPYGLTIDQLKKQLLSPSSSSPSINQDPSGSSPQNLNNYEQEYKQLDILGIGQVNLNDLKFSQAKTYQTLFSKHRLTAAQLPNQNYMKISTYLRENHPEIKKVLQYLKPNTKILQNSDQIVNQLIAAQENSASFRTEEITQTGYSTNRVKLISRENVFKILYPYTDESQLQFILEVFDSNKLTNYNHINDFSFIQLEGSAQKGSSVSSSYDYTEKVSNFVNLYGLIEYVTGKHSDSNQSHSNLKTQITQPTKEVINYLIEWIQQEGGISRIARSENQLFKTALNIVLSSCPDSDIRLKYDNSGDLLISIISQILKQLLKSKLTPQKSFSTQIKSLTKVILQLKTCFQFYSKYQKQSFSKSPFIQIHEFCKSFLVPSITQLMQHHYTKELNLNSTSNNQVQRLKELSIKKYKLLEKMYISCSKPDNLLKNNEIKSKYVIFEELIYSSTDESHENNNSNKVKFDLVDFWMFINTHSDIAYSKAEIDEIFKIIDQNDDKDISFKEFITFWMAVEQVIPKSIILSKMSQRKQASLIQKMKHQLRTMFIEMFSKQIESSSQKNRITHSQILKLFNTSNKQKINKLIEIVFEDKQNDFSFFNLVEITHSKGYDTPVFINNVLETVLDKDQLKIIKRVIDRQALSSQNNAFLNSNQKDNQQKFFTFPRNLILEWIADDLYSFIVSKTKKSKKQTEERILRTEDLVKYILLKYSHLGRSIVQDLYQRNHKSFYLQKLTLLLKSLIPKASEWKISTPLPLHTQDSFVNKILSTLKSGDSLAKTYHYLTKSKINHFFGQSISFRVLLSEIIGEVNFLDTQIDQIQAWIAKECWRDEENLPLIYGVKQKTEYLPQITETKPLADLEIEMKAKHTQLILNPLNEKFSQNLVKEIVFLGDNLLGGKIRASIIKFKSNDKVFDHIEESLALKPDTRFKSNNLATLALNLPMYFDPQLSVGLIINTDEVKKSKGQEIKFYSSSLESKSLRKILSLKRPSSPSMGCLDSLISLAEMNYKMHKKYRTVGLLFDLDNIQCEVQSKTNQKVTFKSRHFYQGVNLGADGNYAEGFDMLKLYSDQNGQFKIVSFPPELDESIYTYAVDSYNFGNLIYLFYTGESFESVKTKENELKQQRQQLKRIENNKIQSSFYFHHSYVHAESIKKIKELMKKMSKKSGATFQSLKSELILYTLIYKCTLYNWYERPQMHQILTALNELKHSLLENHNELSRSAQKFLRSFNQEEIIIDLIEKNNFSQLKANITACKSEKKAETWSISGLNTLKQGILEFSKSQPQNKQFIIELYEFFNLKVKDYLNHFKFKYSPKSEHNVEIETSSEVQRRSSPTKNGLLELKSISPQKSFMKFGETHKSFMMQSNLNSNLSQKHIRQQSELQSPKRTFLQTQSLLYAQKSQIIENHIPQQPKQQNKKLNQQIECLLRMILSHIETTQTKATLWISLFLFKDLLNDLAIKSYLQECDSKWSIESFDILQKIDQINLKDKIKSLPKNKSFYHDFYQLMEDKITLNLMADSRETMEQKTLSDKGIQHDSSKILALNHILSILLSNNLNKLNALYQSQIISKLYIYLSSKDEELKSKVIQIYSLVAKSLKYANIEYQTKRKIQGNVKKIDQVYKTMMVVYDQLQSSMTSKPIQAAQSQLLSPTKKGTKLFRITESPTKQSKKPIKSSPVIDLLTYVENFYVIAGYESVQLIQIICQEQVCHLFSLINLCEEIYAERKNEKCMEMLLHLVSNRKIYELLKNDLVGILIPSKLKVLQKNGIYWREIKQYIELWENSLKLVQISGDLFAVTQNYTKGHLNKIYTQIISAIDKNIIYYKSLMSSQYDSTLSSNKVQRSGKEIAEYNSFYNHFEMFIKFLEKLINRVAMENNPTMPEKDKIFSQLQRFTLLQNVLTYLELTVEDWQAHQTLIRILLQTLNSFYESASNPSNQDLYLSNPQQQNCVSRLLKITQYLSVKQPVLLINQGFIHIYNSILRKQYQRMVTYFEKKVEKIKIVPVYFYQTEWRLSILQSLIHNPQIPFEMKKEVSKELSNLQLGKYIVEDLYVNETIMDLRFYQCFEQGVPYRFSRPFKAEALVMIGILLKDTLASDNSLKTGIQGDVASKIVSLIKPLTETLKNHFENTEKSVQENGSSINQNETLEVVEIIWLFSEISQSSDERLKYQFINTGTHEVIERVFESYKKIRNLFPKFSKIVSSNNLLTSSKVFQKSQLYESRRQFRKSGPLSFA